MLEIHQILLTRPFGVLQLAKWLLEQSVKFASTKKYNQIASQTRLTQSEFTIAIRPKTLSRIIGQSANQIIRLTTTHSPSSCRTNRVTVI